MKRIGEVRCGPGTIFLCLYLLRVQVSAKHCFEVRTYGFKGEIPNAESDAYICFCDVKVLANFKSHRVAEFGIQLDHRVFNVVSSVGRL